MNKNCDRTACTRKPGKQPSSGEEPGYSTTAEIPRDKFITDIPPKKHATLQILSSGRKTRIIYLEEKDVVVGRNTECKIQLFVKNVSRKHAQIIFRNEEYHIEDLGSTNGTYVNGIKVVKCTLRNNDRIDIGEVEIIFNE